MKTTKIHHKLLRTTAFVISVILVLSRPCYILAAQDSDEGTEKNAVNIFTSADLIQLADSCVIDTWSQDKTVILQKDIDLSGTDFSGIPSFGGHFYGNGHTISGLYINYGSDNYGFFRYIQENGEVHDLNLSGSASVSDSHSGLGLLAGSNSGLISNCLVSGEITGGDKVGNITGINEITGIISDCRSKGTIYGNHLIGGIAGENKGSITNSTNHCFVNTAASDDSINLSDIDLNLEHLLTTENAASVTDIGGITGSNSGIIKACVNDGSIGYQHFGYNIGGIAGSQTGYIEGCINYGLLNGRKDVGGIVGQMEPSSELEFSADTLGKLNVEFNKLHQQLTQLDQDASTMSSSLTGQVDALLDSVEAAQHSIDTILNQATDDFSELSNKTDLTGLPTPDPISLEFMKNLASASPSSSPDASTSPDASVTPSTTPEAASTPSTTPETEVTPSPSADTGSYSLAFSGDAPASVPVSTLADDAATPTPASTPVVLPTGLPSSLPDLLPTPSGSILPDMMDKINNVDWDAAEDEINKAQQNTYNTASDVLAQMQNTIQNQSALVSYRIGSARTSLSSSFGQITKDMDSLNVMMNGQNQIILQDFQAVIDELNVISNIITNPDAVDTDDIYKDISDKDTEEDITGKVMNCLNKGKIYGDLNLGGIAGSMSRENNLDPEDDLDIDNENATLNFIYKERMVIRSCQNNASVEGKKDCAGGIAGDMSLGSILESINTGSVKSDGDMIGGIAGNSLSAIRSCSSKCSLSGASQIGGIAGYGTTISDCYSMVQIEEGKDYLGSIAGKNEFKPSSEISHNYFVAGCPAAIDSINYTEAAEPLSYTDFIALPNLPDIFRHIYLTFEADGHTVSTITLDYGASLDPTKIPAVPAREDCSAKWADFDDNHITYDQTVQAIYSEYITTLESVQEKDGRAVLLSEGQYTPQDTLSIAAIDAYPSNSQTLAECWEVKTHADFTGPYTIHYLIPDNMEHPELELLQEDHWVPVEFTQDGSYFVFISSKPDFVFCCIDRPVTSHTSTIIIVAACAAALVCILLVICLYRKKKAHVSHAVGKGKSNT